MNYLVYIEHAAENLQFFLWHRDYTKRFSDLPPSEGALAPEWTAEQAEAEANQQTPGLKQKISAETAAVFKGTDFAPPTASVVEIKGNNPFNTPPRTPMGEAESFGPHGPAWSDNGSTAMASTINHSFQTKTAGAFAGADLKWQPCRSASNNHVTQVLMFGSHNPTIPRGSIAYHCHLHSRWCTSPAQPFSEGAFNITSCSCQYDAPHSIPQRCAYH